MNEASQKNFLVCPNCSGQDFLIKYEATYVYSYNIDSDAPGLKNSEEFLPFLFDKREQKDANQFLECKNCGKHFPCYLNEWNGKASLQELQRAVNNNLNANKNFG